MSAPPPPSSSSSNDDEEKEEKTSIADFCDDEEKEEKSLIADICNVEQDNMEVNDIDNVTMEEFESEEVSHGGTFAAQSVPYSSVDGLEMTLPDGPEIVHDRGLVDCSDYHMDIMDQKHNAADDLSKEDGKFLTGAASKAAPAAHGGKADVPEVILDDSGSLSLESDKSEDFDIQIDKSRVGNDAEIVRNDANNGAAQASPSNIPEGLNIPSTSSTPPATASNLPPVVVSRDLSAPPQARDDASYRSSHSSDVVTETQRTPPLHMADAVATCIDEDLIVEATAMDPRLLGFLSLTDRMKKHWLSLMVALLLVVAAVVTPVLLTRDTSPQQAIKIRNEAITNAVMAVSGESALIKKTNQHSALEWLLEGGAQDLSVDNPRLIQRYVLTLIFYSLKGDCWLDRHLFLTEDVNECLWSKNFECNNNSIITTIDLSYNNLAGSLPSEIGTLTYLETLNLGNNMLFGNIPQNLTMLSALYSLEMQNNILTGSMPESMADMSLLRLLNFNNNLLTGTISTFVGNLVNLATFAVYSNLLLGSIPSEIGSLTKLEVLLVNDNLLTGTLPPEMERITDLSSFYAHDNLLSGSIPFEIGRLTNLEELSIHSNRLSGTLPTEIGQLTSSSLLYAHYNLLSNSIPSEIGKLTRMKELSIHANLLFGTLPMEIGQLTDLSVLNAYNNFLSGPMPSEIGRLTKLENISIHANILNGTLPTEIGQLTGLSLLYAYTNFLSGSIPSEIGKLTRMKKLAIHDNRLNGTLPSEIGMLTQMDLFHVETNEITGSVPSSICSLGVTDFDADILCK